MTPALPPDLRDVYEQLEAAEREARSVIEDLDDARANWQPDDGRSWSVAQCLDHLARAASEYLAPMERALASARRRGAQRRGPVEPGRFAAWFIRSLEPPVARRQRAPRAIVPASALPGGEALARFLAAHDAVRRLLAANADLDLSVRFANPYLKVLRFRTGAGFRIIAAHDRRHLWQARRVRAAAGFPAA
jgi:hypothetical protein